MSSAAVLDKLGLAAEPVSSQGDPNAPITIIEFADFGCPFCRTYHMETFPQIEEQYIATGKVYYIYKDLPIVSQYGDLAAQAAACAGAQGHYWEMHHQLFLDAQAWNAGRDAALATFRDEAKTIGVDPDRLVQCVASGDFAAHVKADADEGFKLGLRGTPAFLINGKLLSGAYPFDVFTKIIEGELSGNPLPTK